MKVLLKIEKLTSIALLLGLAIAIGGAAQAQGPIHHGSLERVLVHGKSLEGNLEGDSPDRNVSVYLPPSYKQDKTRRYPVLFLLHGFTDTDKHWFSDANSFIHANDAADRAFADGVTEMILVMPDANTRYFGSMYSNSVTTGDWEDFIAHDLVSYIDSHYRTIPNRLSRGLAGHSMGGYGTFRIGMKHPEVFSSIYALSACCLAPSLSAFPTHDSTHDLSDEELAKANFFTKAKFAASAAWSPNPATLPRYLDLPRQDSPDKQMIEAKWAANAAIIMLDQLIPNVRQLHAIAFDIGTQDFLKNDVMGMEDAFTRYKIPHTFETYEGDHLNHIEARFEKKVLPFFAKNLTTDTVVALKK